MAGEQRIGLRKIKVGTETYLPNPMDLHWSDWPPYIKFQEPRVISHTKMFLKHQWNCDVASYSKNKPTVTTVTPLYYVIEIC